MDGGWETYLIWFMLGVFPWIFVGIGGWMIWSARKFMKKALRVRGTVVEVHLRSSSSDNGTTTTYQPVFEYMTPDGEMRRGQTWLSSTSYNYAVGSDHEILINPENDTVRIPGFMVYGFGAIFAGIGLVIGIVGIFALSAM